MGDVYWTFLCFLNGLFEQVKARAPRLLPNIINVNAMNDEGLNMTLNGLKRAVRATVVIIKHVPPNMNCKPSGVFDVRKILRPTKIYMGVIIKLTRNIPIKPLVEIIASKTGDPVFRCMYIDTHIKGVKIAIDPAAK